MTPTSELSLEDWQTCWIRWKPCRPFGPVCSDLSWSSKNTSKGQSWGAHDPEDRQFQHLWAGDSQAFLWYDNDKDLTVCFSVMQLVPVSQRAVKMLQCNALADLFHSLSVRKEALNSCRQIVCPPPPAAVNLLLPASPASLQVLVAVSAECSVYQAYVVQKWSGI